MNLKTAAADPDARLADVLDRLAGDLDALACGAADLDAAGRARLTEILLPIADDLHAVVVAVGSGQQ